MPIQRSHDSLIPFEKNNTYTTTQVYHEFSNTFPKGNIQIHNSLDYDYITSKSNILSCEYLYFCKSCGAVKEHHILVETHKKWFCDYCQNANYLSENETNDVVKQDVVTDISLVSNFQITHINFIVLDLCLRDNQDRQYIKIFLDSLINKTLTNSEELMNFVVVLPDNKFLTIEEMQLKRIHHNVNFIENSFKIKAFPWDLINQLIDNVIITETGSQRCKREVPLEIIYSNFKTMENVFVKLLFHQLGPITSKKGKIVSSNKKHLVRKFDDNKYNRESYKLSKKATSYYIDEATKFSLLQKKQNVYFNMALFGCSLDDIGVMELSSMFRVYNFVDDYSNDFNKTKLSYALNKWYREDSIKSIEFESFSTSDLFNIAGIWGDSRNFEKVDKKARNYNKKPIDDLYEKNLVKTDNCKLLSCNSLLNTLNLSYTLKLIRTPLNEDDGVLTEDMLQLKHGSKIRSINLYPDNIKIQNITKFIFKDKLFLQKHTLGFPVMKDVVSKGYNIDHSMLFNAILKKFSLTNINLIRNDIHNITMFMDKYQSILTNQLIHNYLKVDFLKSLDIDIERLLLGFYNIKYTLPIANVVQMTPDEYFMNLSKLIGNNINENILEVYPKENVDHGVITSIELSDIVYLLHGDLIESKKPMLLVNNDSTGRHVSNRTNFTVLSNNHDVVMNYELFKSSIINKAFK